MFVRKLLSSDNSVHVCLHELLDQVQLGERFIAAGSLNVKDADDVLVVEVSKEHHLS